MQATKTVKETRELIKNWKKEGKTRLIDNFSYEV